MRSTLHRAGLVLGALLVATAPAAADHGARAPRGAGWRYVPMLGPWLDLTDRDRCPLAPASCGDAPTFELWPVGDGSPQPPGARRIMDALRFPAQPPRAPTVALRGTHVVPISLVNAGQGLAVAGTF